MLDLTQRREMEDGDDHPSDDEAEQRGSKRVGDPFDDRRQRTRGNRHLVSRIMDVAGQPAEMQFLHAVEDDAVPTHSIAAVPTPDSDVSR